MTPPGPALRLPEPVVAAMRTDLNRVAGTVVAAVVAEVPSYSEPFRGRMGRNIESAVAITLGGFLDMAGSPTGIGPGARIESVFEAAYALGRGEARSGRTMDALAAAYRVGARTAWHDLSATAVENGLPSADVARFAELVFDYIDQLSAASVSGHADELATTGRVRERHLERLADAILEGADEESLTTLATRADWDPPADLTAVIVPGSAVGMLRSRFDGRTLIAGGEAPGLPGDAGLAVLLVPGLSPSAAVELPDAIGDRRVVIGPVRPWQQGRSSYERALRLLRLGGTGSTETQLDRLILTADPAALADLRARVLAPLADLKSGSAEKLTETLRAWLVYQGRREEIAAALYVHPQTVRYRMGRLRELYGDRLTDPRFVLAATVALGVDGVPEPSER